ncbi:D-alanyl-D-alanine carboxypeptidase [Oenococcus sp. UCMA 17063]|nr:D-alanyl-D-alanine carboxypeptidase [Oenococcus sp. UCMA 17063]
MIKKQFRYFRFLLIFVLLFLFVSFLIAIFINYKATRIKLPTVNGEPIQLKTKAASALVVNFKTGQIVAEKNPNKKLAIASTSKLLTAYLVLKAIHEGKLSWNQKIKADQEIYQLSKNPDLMNVTLYKNDSYTVRQLMNSTLLVSTNATGVLLGDAVSGNQTKFAALMNKTAASFGISKSEFKFYNAVGISNSYLGSGKLKGVSDGAENLASSKALATIAYRLFTDYPEVIKIIQQPELNFYDSGKKTSFKSTATLNTFNSAISKTKIKFIAAKNGASKKAGSVMLGLTNKLNNNQQYLSIVMNGSSYEDPLPTWNLTAKIVQDAVAKGKNVVVKKGSSISGADKLTLQKTRLYQVPLKTASKLDFWLQKGSKHVSADPLPYNRKASEIKKGQLFFSEINNFKNFNYLYGVKQPGKIKFQAIKSTKVTNNLIARYWRWLIH